MSLRAAPPDTAELSIGTLSLATGVPVDTLRTWERRYGFPAPVARTEGSHRRYSVEIVPLVQLIVTALDQGHRPSAVVGRSADEIGRLIALGIRGSPRAPDASEDRATIARWLATTLELDAVQLAAELELCLASMSVIDFLERCLAPFLAEVGERWARGELRVSHEHFASERTRLFLNEHWRALAEGTRRDAVTVVLATPPGEHHVLGLHMAAWIIALAGVRVVFLGANTPMAELAFAAQRHQAQGVALSVADGYAGDLSKELDELLRGLPRGVKVAIGGTGSRTAPISSDHKVNRFSDLAQWAEGLRQRPSPP